MRRLLLFIHKGCEDSNEAIKMLHEIKEKVELLFCNEEPQLVSKYNILVVPTLVKSQVENGDEFFNKLSCFDREELKEFLCK